MRRAGHALACGWLALVVLFLATACAEPQEEPAAAPDDEISSAATPADSGPDSSPVLIAEAPATAQGEAPRPTDDEAEQAVLGIAREMYPEIPIESAVLLGLGEDSQGRWWVDVLVGAGEGYESTEWYVVRAGTGWAHVNHGTGMERSHYPSDIEWEDVP